MILTQDLCKWEKQDFQKLFTIWYNIQQTTYNFLVPRTSQHRLDWPRGKFNGKHAVTNTTVMGTFILFLGETLCYFIVIQYFGGNTNYRAKDQGRTKQGQVVTKQGQKGTYQGQLETKQVQAGTKQLHQGQNKEMYCLSLLCPCFSLFCCCSSLFGIFFNFFLLNATQKLNIQKYCNFIMFGIPVK